MNEPSQRLDLLINCGDRRTRNAGDIGANLSVVECSRKNLSSVRNFADLPKEHRNAVATLLYIIHGLFKKF